MCILNFISYNFNIFSIINVITYFIFTWPINNKYPRKPYHIFTKFVTSIQIRFSKRICRYKIYIW